jgi:hypothetical protein
VRLTGVRRAILGLVLLLGGCAPPVEPRAPITVATPAGTVDCGTATVGQLEAPPAAMVDCFVVAAGRGQPARLVITRPTTEGDPTTAVYVVRADGRVEVVTDARLDAYGTGELTRDVCTGATVGEDGFLTLATCAPA